MSTKSTELVLLPAKPSDETRDVRVTELGGDRFRIEIGGDEIEVEGFLTDRGVCFRRDGRSFDLPLETRGELTIVHARTGRFEVNLTDARVHRLKSALGGGSSDLKPEVRSPMTGKVVIVKVEVGQAVAEGDTLVIIEAMKMENEIKATGAATVKAVRVAPGQLVAPGDVLVEFEIAS